MAGRLSAFRKTKPKTFSVSNKLSLSMQPKGWFLSYLFSSEQLMHLLQKKKWARHSFECPLYNHLFITVSQCLGMDLLKVFWENNINFQSK